MAESMKSVLLIDFDSVRRGLSDVDPKAAPLLAERAGAMLEALEKGDLTSPAQPRQVLVRRCYADPRLLGEGAAAFIAAGFEVVECSPHASGRSSAQLHLVIDAIDALNSDAAYDEFILLSADTDLVPLIARLKSGGRRTLIYADDKTRPAYRSMADGTVPAKALAATMSHTSQATPDPVSRAEIETFAHKASAATNLPLLSPKTYAELFRHLAEEIATNGYNFQTTARNVSDKLAEAGRKVTRRQVVFVVKGLALKGHVFSQSDSPRHLAEVFCEQSRYLVNNAGLTLDDSEERLLTAWLVDRAIGDPPTAAVAQAPSPADQPPEPPAEPAPPTAAASQPEPVSDTTAAAAKASRKKKPNGPDGTRAKKPKSPQKSRSRKSAAAKSRARLRDDDAAETGPAAPVDVEWDEDNGVTESGPRKIRSAEQVKAQIAARIAASVHDRRSRPVGNEAGATDDTAGSGRDAGEPKPPPVANTEAADAPAADDNGQALESSILAAIAEAVDVLVEGTADDQAPEMVSRESETGESETASASAAGPAPDPEPSDGGEGDDIGDEIQRIIASYSRDRKDG